MTTEQAIAEIVASKPRCLLGMVPVGWFVDTEAVARVAFSRLEVRSATQHWGLRGWLNHRHFIRMLAADVESECPPKAGCAFAFVCLSGLGALVVSAALYAVVESCVCWWMEHRVLPQD